MQQKMCSLFVFMLLVLTSMGYVQAAGGPSAKAIPEKLPWTLREHYTFSAGPLRLDYAKDNGEWRIKTFQEDSEAARMNPDIALKDVGFSIQMSDGRIITHDELGFGGETIMTREPFKHEVLGDGTHYRISFVPQDGLLVEHSLSTFRQWSFLLLSVKISNQGSAPAGISKISPAIILPGNFPGVMENANISARPLSFRGAYPAYASGKAGTALRVQNPEQPYGFLFAFLPSGFSECGFSAPQGGLRGDGTFECLYAPAKMLAPGASLETDTIFIGFGMSPALMESHYAYLLSHICKPAIVGNMPRAWVTVPDTEGLNVLRAHAANAVAAGIQHALIPGNWERKPGTLEGGASNYPRNMSEAAQALSSAGCKPGITVDPLLGQGGGAWTAQSADGRQWINLNDQAGREFAVSRMRKVLDMGFSFLVVEASTIPDEVLSQFDLTRAQADAYALAAANEAAKPLKAAALPASAGSVNATRDDMLAVASTFAFLRQWNIGTAGVAVRMEGNASLDKETCLALRFWAAPVEFVGAPPRSAQQELAEIFGQAPLAATPQDVSRNSPLIWMPNTAPSVKDAVASSLFAFTGAPAWDLKMTENPGSVSAETIVWKPVEKRIAQINDGRIPASEGQAAFGWIHRTEQPVLAGITVLPFLGLDCVKKCAWNAERNTLAGEISGAGSSGLTACFYSPSAYAVESVKWNGKSVRPDIEGSWITFPLEAGSGTFELIFSRR